MDFVGKIAKDKVLNEISQYDIQQRLEEDPDALEAVELQRTTKGIKSRRIVTSYR